MVQAVHSGADLESAIQNCLGYRSEVELAETFIYSGLYFQLFQGTSIFSGSRLHGWGADKSYFWFAIWITSNTFNFYFNLQSLYQINV